MSEKFTVERRKVNGGHVVDGCDDVIMEQRMRLTYQHLDTHRH